ncbi:unnamed protein product [Caenorhabditis auriculariae]|uniref:Uncharacterized protein n=1 Tax=Caenorhabditis auriculariae TaxID=2777116 RepID=A0A8S1HH29_9PELO|nr:unnamed protein product [Caenorhabditis auriculariae]
MTTPLLVYPERNKQKIIDQKDKNSPIYHQPRLRRSQTRLNSDTKFFFHDFYIDKIEEYCPPSDTNVKKYKHITSPKKIVTTPKARAVTSLPFRRDQQTKTPKRVPIKRRNKSDTGIAPKRKRRALSTERSSERKTGKEVREEEEKEEKDDFSVDDAAKDNDSDVISLDVFEMNLDDPIILSDSDEEDVFEARLEEVFEHGRPRKKGVDN